MKPTISVIVPVYKVEQYINKCVDSIINQSYNNIEIILVDDGSPDSCPAICDEYAVSDNRIKVIHKTNGGLSDARNKGIEFSTGEYLFFVDSDDYISSDSIEYLYNLIVKYDADLAIGGMCITDSHEDSSRQNILSEGVYDHISTIKQMMYNKQFNHSASAKLYKKSLFKDIQYPVGRLYEDLFTTYKVVNKAIRIAYGTQYCYYYYVRPNSIMQSSFTSKNHDVIDGLTQLKRDIPIELYGLQKPYASLVVDSITMLLKKKPQKHEIMDEWNLLVRNRANSLIDNHASKKVRIKALLSYVGINFLKICIKLYSKGK